MIGLQRHILCKAAEDTGLFWVKHVVRGTNVTDISEYLIFRRKIMFVRACGCTTAGELVRTMPSETEKCCPDIDSNVGSKGATGTVEPIPNIIPAAIPEPCGISCTIFETFGVEGFLDLTRIIVRPSR